MRTFFTLSVLACLMCGCYPILGSEKLIIEKLHSEKLVSGNSESHSGLFYNHTYQNLYDENDKIVDSTKLWMHILDNPYSIYDTSGFIVAIGKSKTVFYKTNSIGFRSFMNFRNRKIRKYASSNNIQL